MSLHRVIFSFLSSEGLWLGLFIDDIVDRSLLKKTQDPSGLIKHFSTKRATDRANEHLIVAYIHAIVLLLRLSSVSLKWIVLAWQRRK